MGLNKVFLNGRLPRFEGSYTKGEGEKKSFLSWCISVKRDFKKPDEQYYPEDLLKFKAFGPKADFIMNNFAQGDGLIIIGKLQVEDDYTDKEGKSVKGGMVVMVDEVSFADSKAGGAQSSGSKAPTAPTVPGAKATTPPGASRPAVPGAAPARPGAPAAPGRPTFAGGRPTIPGAPGAR